MERHLQRHIPSLFRTHFSEVYINDESIESILFTGGIVRSSSNFSGHLLEEYRRRLGTPEGTIRLSQLTSANAFEMIPLFLSIKVSFTRYSDVDQQKFIEDMLETLNYFSNNRLNAEVEVIRGGGRWHYIQGEQVFLENQVVNYFHNFIFESYKSLFW